MCRAVLSPCSCLWGMVLWLLPALPLRLHTMPYVSFYAPWCVLLPLWCKNRNWGELRLLSIVPIRTVFGTDAVLVGSAVVVAFLRNFTSVVLGIGYIFSDIFADLLWSASDDK